MTRIKGLVAGSYDPFTNGHLELIKRALPLVDTLFVVAGINPTKKYYFTEYQRMGILRNVLQSELSPSDFQKVQTVRLEDDLLMNFAQEIGATYQFRGLRNTTDFVYENDLQTFNHVINPNVQTVYIISPPQLSSISSSAIKSIVGFKGWEEAISKFVHPITVNAFKKKLANNQ